MQDRIEHTTLAEKAYAQLRSGLISTQFRPGEILKIRSLADQYGISATPVREALQRLVVENALEMQPNKSFRVPVLTVVRFNEIRRIRCALEPIASKLAFKNLGKNEVRHLEKLVEEMQEAVRTRNIADYMAGNERFHFGIYERSEAPLLVGMIRDLWMLAAPYFALLFEGSNYPENSNDWHKQAITAVRQNNADAFGNAVYEDINLAAEDLVPKLQETFLIR